MAKTERKRTSGDSAKGTGRKAAARAEREPVTDRPVVKAARRAAARDGDVGETEARPRTRTKTAERGGKDRKRGLPAEISSAVQAALDKKAQDVVVLDLRDTPAFTDFFILCSGLNPRQVKAIADSVDERLRAQKLRPAHTEGYERAEWILMDYFTFIVHVFTPQTRTFYSLERLWGDAERLDITDEPPAKG